MGNKMGELCTVGDLCEAPKSFDGARKAPEKNGEFSLGDEQPPQQTQSSTVELYKGINLDLNNGGLIADSRVYPNQIPDHIMKLVVVKRAEYLRAQEEKNKTKTLDTEQEEANQLPMALSHLPVEVNPKRSTTQQAYSKRQEAASGRNTQVYSRRSNSERVYSKRSNNEQVYSKRSDALSYSNRQSTEQERFQAEAGQPSALSGVKTPSTGRERDQEVVKSATGNPSARSWAQTHSIAGQEHQHGVAKGSRRSRTESHQSQTTYPRGYDVDGKEQTLAGTNGTAGAVTDSTHCTPPRVVAASQVKPSKLTPTIVLRKSPAQAHSKGRPENVAPVFEEGKRNSQIRRRRKRSRRRRKNFCC